MKTLDTMSKTELYSELYPKTREMLQSSQYGSLKYC